MGEIRRLSELDEQTISRLINIWESSVRTTHNFLSEHDIAQIKCEVYLGIKASGDLYCFYDNNGVLRGFSSVINERIEMLFVEDKARGQGIGKRLLSYAIDNLGARFVDVNEQNEQGIGFYTHMGFHVIGRPETDEHGRPFPLLHLML